MKKKVISIFLVVALVAIAAVGTLAYFTDTDSATNVMTTGKVDIAQYEKDKEGNDFDQNQPLMPRVDTGDEIYWNSKEDQNLVMYGWYNTSIENVVDKVVTVKNEAETGAENQNVYVRTILAFETATEYAAGTDTVLRDGQTIFDTYLGVLGNGLTYLDGTTFIDGVEYVIAYKVYEDELAPQDETEPSLKQIFLSPDANNEVMTLFGNEYTILALSQGTQVAGFESVGAAGALNEAFEEVTLENAKAWFEAIA